MRPPLAAFIVSAVAVVSTLTLTPADATQAYGSDGWSVLRSGDSRSAIKACSVSGRTVKVAAVGGAVLTVDNVRIIAGRQSQLDNVIVAERFVRLRAASQAGQRVNSCRVAIVGGIRRMVVTTTGGARWSLVRPKVGSYFMTWAS